MRHTNTEVCPIPGKTANRQEHLRLFCNSRQASTYSRKFEKHPKGETVLTEENTPLQIDVISDVMCPWCYIGKRRLEKALSLFPDIDIDLRWRPYQLDATIPPEGMDRQEYLSNKFGGAEKAREVYEPVVAAGRAESIPFAFDDIERSPNTIDAHRIIRWAASADCQDEVVERLFEMYFVEGRDLTKHETLLEAATDVGMDGEIVSNLLYSESDRDLITKEVAMAQEIGVRGVPCFIVANKYVVMGAEQPETIAGAINMALKGDADEEAGNTEEPH